jgi:Holliday junction DNA helicase RuvA
MIRRVSGEIVEILDESVVLRTGSGLCYEALVGSYALPELQALMGAKEPVEIHTHHYIEGNVAAGQTLTPRLVGFLTPAEREFFLLFIKVPGISPRSGIKALGLPPERIIKAIANRDISTLTRLSGIGKKKAEQIISQLAEEMTEMTLMEELPEEVPAGPEGGNQRSEAMAILVGQLGLRTPEAEELVDRAVGTLGNEAEAPAILEEVFRIRR